MTEPSNTKVYYAIGEVAQMLGVNVSCVRYWAGEFKDYVKPNRNKKGDRFFTQRDVATLKKIKYLVEDCGLKLRGAKARLDAERHNPKQPKPAGRPAQADQPIPDPEQPPMQQPDELAIKANLVERLTRVSAMLQEINKYL